MADYILSCCSTADLTPERFAEKDIHYVCFHYYLDDVEYKDDLYQSMDATDFYTKMEEGVMTKTSQVNVEEFIEYFTPFLEEGKDILHVTLSSGLSGVYNSACTARDFLKEKFPERTINIVDSLGASTGYGLLMVTLAEKRDEGLSLEELTTWAEENKLKLHHWFFSTTLEYYVRGGRISKASGWFGTLLKICPLLNMDNHGHLIPRYKIRGKNAVVQEIVNKMEEHAQDGTNYSGRVFVNHSVSDEDAKAVADLVEKRFKKMNGKVEVYNIGTTIGAHTGPGTVSLFFWGDERTE